MPSTALHNNLTKLLNNNPQLQEVLMTLYTHHITYGLYAGCYVSLMTSNRDLVDLDILVADDDMKKIIELFPQATYIDKGYARFLSIDSSPPIEFMSHANVSSQGHIYLFRLTELAHTHSHTEGINGTHITLLNPADTILLKSMLQRGESEGKHDIEDIMALLQHTTIDKAYLQERMKESKADDTRVTELLRSLRII
jgi:hypothetical protein